jgi:predicted RNase H-like HicB family nuclease
MLLVKAASSFGYPGGDLHEPGASAPFKKMTDKEEHEGYAAEAVGLPGCFSQGKTMEEATGNIIDAIKGCLYIERKHIKQPYDLGTLAQDRRSSKMGIKCKGVL